MYIYIYMYICMCIYIYMYVYIYMYNRKFSSHYDHEQSYTSNVHPMHFWWGPKLDHWREKCEPWWVPGAGRPGKGVGGCHQKVEDLDGNWKNLRNLLGICVLIGELLRLNESETKDSKVIKGVGFFFFDRLFGNDFKTTGKKNADLNPEPGPRSDGSPGTPAPCLLGWSPSAGWMGNHKCWDHRFGGSHSHGGNPQSSS